VLVVEIKLSKQQEECVINANGLGAFYRHVNQRVTHRSGIGALIDSSGNTVVSDVAKEGMFNEHFAAVGIIDNGVTSTPALYTEFFGNCFVL